MRFRQGSDQRSDPELDHEGHQASQTGEEGNIKENKRIPQLYRYVFGVEISMSMRKMGPGRSALWLALLLMGCLVHSAEPQRSDEAGSGSAGSGEVSGSAGSGEDSGSAGSEEDTGSAGSGEVSGSAGSGEDSGSAGSGEVSGSAGSGEDSGSAGSGEDSGSAGSGEDSSSKESGEESSSTESGESSSKESGESSSKESGESSSKESEESSSKESGEESSSKESGEESSSKESGESSSKESEESSSKESGEESSSKESGEESSSKESGEESSSKESGEESSSKESGEESSSKESGEESSSKESGESSSKESGEESSSKESGEESSSKESGESSSKESGESSSKESEESSSKESGEESSSKESGESSSKESGESSSKESGESSSKESGESSSKESGESSSKESGESSSKESGESSSKESGESSSQESGESGSQESGGNSGRSSSSGCDPGWSHHGSKCYKVASGTFTYAEAEAKCTELNAQPALSKDRATNDFIVRLRNSADSSQPVWIGLKFENAGGFFFLQTRRARWIDGELLSDGNFDDWADGEPNDEPGRDADCVRIHQTDGDNPGWSDQWRDYPCDRETLGVICETEARPAGECSADKGVCSASGDPHYTTFDGRRHHFQGYCSYTFAKDCGDNSVFTVETKNVPLTVRPVAVVREVYVKAYGFEIGILQRKKVTVDGKAASLPISVADGNIEVHLSGRYVRVRLTDLCVEVFYDGRHRVKVEVPDNYKDRMCGLCGNYNDNPGDDFIKADGTTAPNWTEFGNSHLTDMSTCPGGDIGPAADAAEPECDDSLNAEVSAADKCGLLKDAGGPFAAGHVQVDPSGAFDDCVFDMCARDGDVEGLCENLEAYADASREAGVDAFAWRTADRCPLECPENSAYSLCTSACPATCTTPDAPDSCSRGCVEGCECAEGFVLSGLDCVPQEQCGCTDDEGRYYVVEESWEEDGKDCACREGNSIVCEDTDGCSPSPCDPNAECQDVAAPDTGATCTCNDGYEGDGEADGSGCTAVQCSPPTAPENGALSPEGETSYDYQDEVAFSCNQGYELDGAASVTCQADREWSAPVPTCEPVQCSPPTAPENGALSSEGATSYDYQDEVTFTCNQGYGLDGAASVTCQADRQWSAPLPTCKPVQCSPPTAPENGALSPEGATSYDYQDEVTFSCNPGYELDGAASVMCQADREWSAPVPTCEPVQCSPPTAPENGALSPEGAESYDYQDEVTFSCNPGYELDGAASVTCQADQQWSAPVPACEPVQCSPPTAPENGALSPEGATSFDYQDEVTFTCNPGYELDGAASVMCQADREWSASVPTCEPVLADIEESDDDDDTHGGMCDPNPCYNGAACTDGDDAFTCTCLPGFAGEWCGININECDPDPCENGGACTDGVASYTCDCAAGFEGAQCEINIDDCDPNPCQNGGACTDAVDSYTCDCTPGFEGDRCETDIDGCSPDPCVPNAECQDNAAPETGATCTCNDGYEGDGQIEGTGCTDTDGCSPSPCDPNAECQDVAAPDTGATCTCNDGYEGDGEADGSGCTAVQCSPPTAPENGALSSEGATSYDYQDEVEFSCNQGYELDGAASVTCQADQQWSAPVPTCNPVQCGALTAPAHGTLSAADATSYQDVVQVTCEHGYELDGASSVTCQADGTWSEPLPACQAVQCATPSAPENGALSPEGGDSFDYQDEVTFSCNPGYDQEGSSSVTCQADKEWSEPIPTCKPVQCSPPTAPENGALSPEGETSYDYQDEITFSCNQGYELDGAASVTCQADQQWSAPAPTCKRIDRCDPNPCQNEGACNDVADSYTCECEAGFEGDQCEINIDDCTPDLCKNGGVCTDGDNSFLCECAAGFHGPTCELVITKSTCVAYGDPHHETLDGASHDFQGTCRYTLTKDLGPDADFNVEVQEVPLPWLTSASVVREVYMEVHGYRIDIRQQKIVSVDEKIRSLPFSLDGGKIQVELSGLFVHIRTDLGVELFYDGKHYAKVVVPSNYQEQVGGLCGNYNGDPSDDFTTRDGAVVSDVNTFGRTWLTSVATCPGGIIGPVGEPPSCDEDIRATAESAERCGLIKEPNGPFAVCHDAVDPQRFFNSCVFDMCARNGDMVGLCEDFETYADACVDAGVHSFFWRTHSLCPGQCPANSRYSSCTSFCPATCARDTANDCDRDHDCVEGCECNPGFILSGQSCVPVDQCGCTHSDGRYFALGERFGEDDKNCVCAKGNDITCEASGCDEDGSCDDVDICQTVDCGQKRECKETPGGYECACKKPFKEVEGSCRGFFTYSVVTRLLANEFYDELYDSNSEEFKNLVKEVRNAVKDLYGKGELTKNEFLDMDIREFVPGSIIAHYQLYLLDDSALVREAGDDVPYILQETLKKLAKAHNGTHLMIEHEEGHQVSDHDECASPVDNDCSPFATCRNMVGNFKCACLDGYEDRSAEFEDPPGRVCQKAGMAASPTVYMWVVVAVVLGLLAAVLVLLAWRVRLARARTENRKYMGGPKDTAPIMTAPYTA
ncbi:CSMD1 [Branchiostoma lanceolatum]|uniref:CSMD1 protein n=1 Tax=Branchiostoma lanceolatum TaxID=7740 RepID=A0A8K0EVT7_BRALA|nr:CSMD1 [Branchiostoma lanceolatum]